MPFVFHKMEITNSIMQQPKHFHRINNTKNFGNVVAVLSLAGFPSCRPANSIKALRDEPKKKTEEISDLCCQ